MKGVRVHLAGSASKACRIELLEAAHAFVSEFVNQIGQQGAGLVLGVGAEPLGTADLPCIFDWTALATIAADIGDGSETWPDERKKRFVAVSSQRGLEKISAARRQIWDEILNRQDFDLIVAPPGWRMAEPIRERQLQVGDILVVIGGGAGVERLAENYIADGKPVIPLHSGIGSYSNDGRGGSDFLHQKALSKPEQFFQLREGTGGASAQLSQLVIRQESDFGQVATSCVNLISDLKPRPAFFVRLLDDKCEDWSDVEAFFRNVVDGVVAEIGFEPYEMGIGRPQSAFINVEIFEAIHRAGLVVVDLTGVRPNCMMELGYALGRSRHTVISAKSGTKLPFDCDKIPTFFWDSTSKQEAQSRDYLKWILRHIDLPPLVS